MQSPAHDFSRLYWQCRRGMLELDLLLQNFMQRRYHLLTRPQQRAFEQLLTTSDQLLLEYLMGRTVPIDTDVAHIVEQIRKTAETEA